jgi:hypothetical protein
MLEIIVIIFSTFMLCLLGAGVFFLLDIYFSNKKGEYK